MGIFTLLQVRNFSLYYWENWPNLSMRPLEKKQLMTCIFVLYWHYLQAAHACCHTSRSPSSVSYKTIVSTLLTHVRGNSICFLSCRYHKADRGKKTDFTVCEGRYFAILPEVLRKHRMGRKGSGQYKQKDV